MDDPEAIIQEAAALARRADNEGAKTLLGKLLRQEPGNVRAWYLLSQVIEPDKRRFCLEKVLELDPCNPNAQARLEAIDNPPPAPEASSQWNFEPVEGQASMYKPPEIPGAVSGPAVPPTRKAQPKVKHKEKRDNFSLILYGTAGVVMLCIFVCGGLWLLGFWSINGLGANDFARGSSEIQPAYSYSVVYKVEGANTGVVSVGYYDVNGRLKIKEVGLPWSTTIELPPGKMLMLLARTQNKDTQITCILEVNGVEVARNGDRGNYASCSLSGVTP